MRVIWLYFFSPLQWRQFWGTGVWDSATYLVNIILKNKWSKTKVAHSTFRILSYLRLNLKRDAQQICGHRQKHLMLTHQHSSKFDSRRAEVCTGLNLFPARRCSLRNLITRPERDNSIWTMSSIRVWLSSD